MELLLPLLLLFSSSGLRARVRLFPWACLCTWSVCGYRVLCPFATHVYAAKPEHKQADTPLTTSCFTSNSLSRSSIKITESRVVCAVQTLNSAREVPRRELLFPLCFAGRLPFSQREGNICSHLLAMGCCKRRRISAFISRNIWGRLCSPIFECLDFHYHGPDCHILQRWMQVFISTCLWYAYYEHYYHK